MTPEVMAAAALSLQLVVPAAIGGPAEVLPLCRDASGRFTADEKWQPIDPRAPSATAVEGARCRVLIRDAGRAVYFSTAEIAWARDAAPLGFYPRLLRTLRAPRAAAPAQFVGVSGSLHECDQLRDHTRCLFIPTPEPGVILSQPLGVTMLGVVSDGGVSAAWQEVAPGRLVRIRSAGGADGVTAMVTRLDTVLRRGKSLLREAAPVAGAEVIRVGPTAFWIGVATNAVDATHARLEVRASGAATMRIPLADLRGAPTMVADVVLRAEDVIEGSVQSRGTLVEGAIVTLARLIEGPGISKDDDRLREWVGEVATGPDGSFRFGGLDRGKYELVALHAAAGRARLLVTPPAFPRVVLTPPPVARGRVLRAGVPVPGATVAAAPAFESLAEAANPLMLMAQPGKTMGDGRFEVMLPESGRVLLTIGADGAAVRIDLGEVSSVSSVLELGDIKLEPAIDVDVWLDLPQTCRVRAVGPAGLPGLSVVAFVSVQPGRWAFQARLPGRWVVEAACGGQEIALQPAVIDVRPGRREPVVLKVLR